LETGLGSRIGSVVGEDGGTELEAGSDAEDAELEDGGVT